MAYMERLGHGFKFEVLPWLFAPSQSELFLKLFFKALTHKKKKHNAPDHHLQPTTSWSRNAYIIQEASCQVI